MRSSTGAKQGQHVTRQVIRQPIRETAQTIILQDNQIHPDDSHLFAWPTPSTNAR